MEAQGGKPNQVYIHYSRPAEYEFGIWMSEGTLDSEQRMAYSALCSDISTSPRHAH